MRARPGKRGWPVGISIALTLILLLSIPDAKDNVSSGGIGKGAAAPGGVSPLSSSLSSPVRPHLIVNIGASDPTEVSNVLTNVAGLLMPGDTLDLNHDPKNNFTSSGPASLATLDEDASELASAAPVGVTISAHSGYLPLVGDLANNTTQPPIGAVVATLEPDGATSGLNATWPAPLDYFNEVTALAHAHGLISVGYPSGSYLPGGSKEGYGWNYGELAASVDQLWVEMQGYAYNGGAYGTSVLSTEISNLISQMNEAGQPLSKLAIQIILGDASTLGVDPAQAVADIQVAEEAGITNIDLWTSGGYESYLPTTIMDLRPVAGTPTATPTTIDYSQQTATITPATTDGTPPYSYAWYVDSEGTGVCSQGSDVSLGGGSTWSTGSEITGPGSYYYCDVVSDSHGNSEPSGYATVTVDPALAALPSANPDPVDVGQTATISADASGGSGSYTSFQWSNLPSGCGEPGNVASFSCTPMAGDVLSSPYAVQVSVTDSNGDTLTEGLVLTVAADPTVSVTPAGPLSYDVGQAGATLAATVTYSGPDSADISVEWWSSPSSPVCGDASYVDTGISGLTLTPSTGSEGTTYYCAIVTDSAVPGPYTSDSNAVKVTVATTYPVTFSEGGLPSGLTWSVTFNGVAMSLTTDGGTDTLTFANEVTGVYSYSIAANPGYHQSTIPYAGTEDVSGGPLAVSVTYVQETYSLSFSESGLSPGTSWSVTLGGNLESSTGTSIFFSEPNSTYGYTVGAVGGYISNPSSGSVVVNGAAQGVAVTFAVDQPLAITVSPTQGPVGATILVSGTGFTASTKLESLVLDSKTIASCTSGSLTTNSAGAWSCTFKVPSGASGTTVTATEVGGTTATGAFMVTVPVITVGPTQGPVGAKVTVSGTGFSVSATLKSLTFDSKTISSCTSGSFMSGATGSFSCTFTVPKGTSGTTVKATDVGGLTGTAKFTVTTPKISLSSKTGAVGATVTLSGTGFSVASTVRLVVDGVTISGCTSGSLTTSGKGSFSCTFAVPAGTLGTTVTATDAGGQTATAKFTVK